MGSPLALHLFSGPTQRSDGIKAMFRQRGWDCEDFDIVNGAEQDLSRDDVWTKLLVRIKGRAFRFIVLGPPCSTFSRAREKQPGPRPLRSEAFPYGLPREELTEPERKELKLGNFFMLMSAAACRAAIEAGTPGVMENPEPFAGHASAFLFDEWRSIADTPGVSTINFDQCKLGAETAKPTRLLVWGVDLSGMHEVRCDHSHRCWAWSDAQGRPRRSWGPHPPLVGRKRGNGEYATRAAAAYPAKLNERLVEAALAAYAAQDATGAAANKHPRSGGRNSEGRGNDPLGIGADAPRPSR